MRGLTLKDCSLWGIEDTIRQRTVKMKKVRVKALSY